MAAKYPILLNTHNHNKYIQAYQKYFEKYKPNLCEKAQKKNTKRKIATLAVCVFFAYVVFSVFFCVFFCFIVLLT